MDAGLRMDLPDAAPVIKAEPRNKDINSDTSINSIQLRKAA